MASVTNDGNGRRRIQFTAGDGSRKTLRLGPATAKQAETFRTKIEALISATITGSMDDEVSRWVAGLDDTMHKRIAAVGLVSSRINRRMSLGAFIDSFLEGRPDLKPHTVLNIKQVRRWLVDCLGETRDLRTIGTAEAEEWRTFMVKGGLGENTIRRHTGRARQLFKAAGRRGLIHGTNPFEGMAATVRGDKARAFFVSRESAQKIIDACPDAQWRLIFTLSRFGGLRCPSETLALKWSDVDLEKGLIRVPSPKTEHIEGKESRMLPMFPELRVYLMEVLEEAGFAVGGGEPVITRYRSANANLRTQFQRIIARAGLNPWPKLFHNLRATRQTELSELFPSHVVCGWIGNSVAVAREHYLQVTDEHFARAVNLIPALSPSSSPALSPSCPVVGKATQNPTQSASVSASQQSSNEEATDEISRVLRVEPVSFELMALQSVPPRGIEPLSPP
jgi:integrase